MQSRRIPGALTEHSLRRPESNCLLKRSAGANAFSALSLAYALEPAAAAGNVRIVKLLFDHGAKLAELPKRDRWDALHAAASNGFGGQPAEETGGWLNRLAPDLRVEVWKRNCTFANSKNDNCTLLPIRWSSFS